MKKRLVELLRNANQDWLRKEYDGEISEKIEEYVASNLLANGVIVPPCKVGDAVYAVSNNPQNTLVQCRVSAFEITTHDAVAIIDIIIGDLVLQRQRGIYFGNFGKTVFLTREEAEKALAEREGEG